MTHLVVLALLVLLPIALIVLFRVNAAIAFMSLALGNLLVIYTSSDVLSIATGLSTKPGVMGQWIRLGLLIAPFVLTLLFTRKSIGGGKQIINLLPAVASGLLFALLATPLLSPSLQASVKSEHIWHLLSQLETSVILAGAFFSLVFLLFSHRGAASHSDEKKHSKHKD
jgi:hypothetical protein